mmetsp:Transcript_5497/g.8605  ORF Transcript_5497/g.8605 Transcript_5497/m.8605 type:complete len:84 (+) Transcript_5497:3414-3665(+)
MDDVQELQRELQKMQRDSHSDLEGQHPLSENPVGAENFKTERGLDTNRVLIPKNTTSREASKREAPSGAADALDDMDEEFNDR